MTGAAVTPAGGSELSGMVQRSRTCLVWPCGCLLLESLGFADERRAMAAKQGEGHADSGPSHSSQRLLKVCTPPQVVRGKEERSRAARRRGWSGTGSASTVWE